MEVVYNRMRRDWIQFKPANWTLSNFQALEFAANICMDKELIEEDYANIRSDTFIKLKNYRI